MSAARAFGLGLMAALVALLPMASAALAAPAPGPALPGPPLPCGPLVSGCLPVPVQVPVPTPGAGQPQSFATATPSPGVQPTASPSPGTAPVPAPGQIPTDFGIQAMTHWVYNGGSWLAPQIYPLLTAPIGPTDWFGPLYPHMVNISFLFRRLLYGCGRGPP